MQMAVNGTSSCKWWQFENFPVDGKTRSSNAPLVSLFKTNDSNDWFCGSWLVGFLISQALTIWFSLLLRPKSKIVVLFVRFLWSYGEGWSDESESSSPSRFRRQLWQEETKQIQLKILRYMFLLDIIGLTVDFLNMCVAWLPEFQVFFGSFYCEPRQDVCSCSCGGALPYICGRHDFLYIYLPWN